MERVQPARYHTYLYLSSLITTMRLESHAADDLEGLFAFFYVCLHFLTYIGPDQSFDLGGMWRDIEKRRFITAGLLGFAPMIPLALTSTAGWIRRFGRETVADASPRNLRDRDLRSDPLLLAREIGCAQAAFLRCALGNPAVVALGYLVPEEVSGRSRLT
jgi:hypothetical protein